MARPAADNPDPAMRIEDIREVPDRYLYLLGRMTPTQVAALPPDAQNLRRERLHVTAWGMTADELRTAIPTMPVRYLGWMTRDQVDQLGTKLALLRRERMLAEDAPWTMGRIAEYLDCTHNVVRKYRRKFLATGKEGPDALPPPDIAGDFRMPGDKLSKRGADSPRWTARTILEWGRTWGPVPRCDEDFVPRPGGRKPGPPPGPRLAVVAETPADPAAAATKQPPVGSPQFLAPARAS